MPKWKGLLNKNFRALLWVAVFAVAIYLIVKNISVFGNVLLVLVGFGAVVIVHEFGHFIVAKLSDIKVEAFSIFMPPTLLGVRKTEDGFQFRILPRLFPKENDESDESAGGGLDLAAGKKGKTGETEYRIGLIPFGGFVKMLGQDDIGPIKASDDPRSFGNKPVFTRMAVIAAGVIFNTISAIIVFMIVFLIGINRVPAVVGAVVPNSPAAKEGLRPGDEIVEIAGKHDGLEYYNIAIAAALSRKDEKVALKVKREDGSIEDFELEAEQKQTPIGQIKDFGILPPQTLTVAELSKDDANTLLERTGLMPGDRIKAANGTNVQTHWQLAQIIQNAFAPTITLLVERTNPVSKKVELIEREIRLTLDLRKSQTDTEVDLGHVYSMVPRLQITDVLDELNESGVGSFLQSGDIILAIGDVENPTYKEMREVTTEYEDRELSIKVLREDANGVKKVLTTTVVPKRKRGTEKVMIGIGVKIDVEHPVVARTIATKEVPVPLAIPRGATIMAVAGVPVSSFYDIAREIGRYAGGSITMDYRVDEQTVGNVVLDVGNAEDFVPVKSAFADFIPFEPLERLYKASGPIDAIVMGYKKTVMFIIQTYVTIKRLIGGVVSPKLLMGPVGIVTSSYRIVAEQPLIEYAYWIGLISAMIAVFNLLPLLPFDGGHIVFLLVEKIKGSPVSERVQGVIAYAGWVLIAMLLLYVTFNDIVRIIRSLPV